MEPRTLIICTTQRTGSNLLCEYLLTSWKLGWPAEWFNPPTVAEFKARLGLAESAPITAYREAIRADRSSPNGYFGLKLMWDHLLWLMPQAGERADPRAPRVAYDFLHQFFPAPCLVLLEREDRLAQAISMVKAQQSGVWIARQAEETQRAAPYTYDPDAIRRALLEIETACSGWRRALANTPHLYLSYESFLADPDRHLRALARYAGVADDFTYRVPDNIHVQRDARSEDWAQRYRAENAAGVT